MKFVFCLVVLAAVAVSYVSAIAGQSACRDPSEVGQTYTHHFDPVSYWHCETINEPAVEMRCPEGEAYMDLLKACIPWSSYIWKKPKNPPTLA